MQTHFGLPPSMHAVAIGTVGLGGQAQSLGGKPTMASFFGFFVFII